MLQLLLLIGTIGPILSQSVHNVVIPRGKPYEIISPNYPDVMGWNDGISVEWNLQVDDDSKVKIVCTDIRMVQREQWTVECPDVYFSVEDGKGETKVCGNVIRDFIYLSDGPRLKVKTLASSKGSGMVSCVALNTADPAPEEIVKMDPHSSVRIFKIDGNSQNPFPYLDRLWIFESPPGTRMSFQCDLSVDEKKPICGWNALRFNNGETEEEFCESKPLLLFSKENKAKLRFLLDNYGHGRMNCLVQAVTGPHPDEYENVVLEQVDSSEHGVTPGTKQTSCKCGWANKNGARIIKGIESRVNEFPWMVHLHTNHETDEGMWGASCGGSIITARHILTAAHCVVLNKKVAKPVNIHMELAKHDSRNPSGKEITIGAEKVFVREKYLREGLYSHDIAVIFTNVTIDFSTSLVGPVCVEQDGYPLINKFLTIMGWGRTEDAASSTFLRKGKSLVMDPLLCGASEWDVCTTSKPSSFCSGDSGGPLVRLDSDTNRYSQVSIVSRGNSCTGKYMISTLVGYFYDWIQEVIKGSDSSVSTCHKI